MQWQNAAVEQAINSAPTSSFVRAVSSASSCIQSCTKLSRTWRGHETYDKLVTTSSKPLRSRKTALIPTSITTAYYSHSTPRNASSVQRSNCIIRYLLSGSLKSETILVPSYPKYVVCSPPASMIISRSSRKCVSVTQGRHNLRKS
jgi:hypothetical protein